MPLASRQEEPNGSASIQLERLGDKTQCHPSNARLDHCHSELRRDHLKVSVGLLARRKMEILVKPPSTTLLTSSHQQLSDHRIPSNPSILRLPTVREAPDVSTGSISWALVERNAFPPPQVACLFMLSANSLHSVGLSAAGQRAAADFHKSDVMMMMMMMMMRDLKSVRGWQRPIRLSQVQTHCFDLSEKFCYTIAIWAG